MPIRRQASAICLLLAGLGAAHAQVAPPLVTIGDTLYKADGTRFSGTATIAWNSFEASDASNITKHSLTVKIVDGQFLVRLVPNADATPPAYYSVRFVSDGRIQFDETWRVPASSRPLRLRDIRVAGPAPIEQPPATIGMEGVAGLVAELSMRPVRGPGFVPGRAAIIGTAGALEAATGSPSDCIRVDGSSGPCGGGGGLNMDFIDHENPAGAVDGGNHVFTLAAAPAPPSSLTLHRNGMLQKPGFDYTLEGRAVSFLPGAIPQPADTLLASYRMQREGPFVEGPEVLCSGAGGDTGGTVPAVLGACPLNGRLNPGDRVEVQFDFSHEGAAAGFAFEIRWGSTTVVRRSAGAGETLVTGRAEAAVGVDGTQLSVQSWGAVLPLAVGVAASTDPSGGPEAVEFLGNLETGADDRVRLRHYTVIRYPAI